jgi:hypothetical protein
LDAASVPPWSGRFRPDYGECVSWKWSINPRRPAWPPNPITKKTKGVLKVVDASHILVGALTAISFAFLVWIEIGSRRNSAAQIEQNFVATVPETVAPPNQRSRRQ